MKEGRMPEAELSDGNSEKIFESLKDLLKDISEDWETVEVTTETRLVDLGMESISLVYLIAELQQMYRSGRYLVSQDARRRYLPEGHDGRRRAEVARRADQVFRRQQDAGLKWQIPTRQIRAWQTAAPRKRS